jgi:hypothetical protein
MKHVLRDAVKEMDSGYLIYVSSCMYKPTFPWHTHSDLSCARFVSLGILNEPDLVVRGYALGVISIYQLNNLCANQVINRGSDQVHRIVLQLWFHIYTERESRIHSVMQPAKRGQSGQR